MDKSQEPKYDAIDGKIVNRATGQPIPDDEPIFILRGKDLKAAKALRAYHMTCENVEHRKVVAQRIEDFERFAQEHPDRMKLPDTRLPESEPATP